MGREVRDGSGDEPDDLEAPLVRDAAIALPTSATSEQIRAAVTTALGSPTLRARETRYPLTAEVRANS